MSQHSYDSINTIKMSDHRPVFSQFELKFEFDDEVVQKEHIVDVPKVVDEKVKKQIKDVYAKSTMREKNMGKNKSKACVIF